MLKPLADHVIVEVMPMEEKTAFGLVIPDTAIKEKPMQGTILAVGPGRVYDNGTRVPIDVKVGDKVIFAKYCGTEIKVDGKPLLVLSERDLFAVID